MPKKFVVGISIVVVAIAYFMFAGVSKGTAYYITVDELTQNGNELIGERLRMGGNVLEGTIEEDIKTLNVTFQIHQEESVVPVKFTGVTPDMFKDGSEVIVEGEYTAEGVFEADVLLAKCPSKYESKEYEDAEETGEEVDGEA